MQQKKVFVRMWLSALLLSRGALAQVAEPSFAEAWQAFDNDYAQLNQTNETFTQQITPHVATFNRYKAWMEETTQRLSSNDVDELQINQAFYEYRSILKQDKTCSSASLQTLQTDLQASLRHLKNDLEILKNVGEVEAKTADKTKRKSLKASIAEADKATGKAEATILSYSEKLNSSTICATLSNYDLVLVAAETLSATHGSNRPLYLSSYLSNSVLQKEAFVIKDEALAYLDAVEASFTRNIELGDITQSLMLLNRLDGNIAFGTAATKVLAEADRNEVERKKTALKVRIKTMIEEKGVTNFEGMKAMVEVKAKATYDHLVTVERQSVRASDQRLFAETREFCLSQLRMKAADPYTVPPLKNLEDVLEYEANLNEAQNQLRTLEKSRELASRS